MTSRSLILLTVLALWSPPVGAHGGPPTTHDILLGLGDVSLVTSHGFFSEQRGWEWMCEEASGADQAASAARTPSRWFVGTLSGLRTSTDGCDWPDDPGLAGVHVLRVLQDSLDSERVWAVTQAGLWAVDGAEDAVLERPLDVSVRHAGQRADGTWLVVGFDGADPVGLLGDERIPLPVETGRMEVVSSDDQGRFYVRAPIGLTDRLLRVSEAGAELLLPVTDLIRDVAVIDERLYVLTRSGVAWSTDGGETWSDPVGEAIGCLRRGPDGFYACPPGGGMAAAFHAPTLPADPRDWAWEALVDFAEVTKNTCEMGTTAGDLCPYLWRVAGEELGATMSEATEAEGCATTQGGPAGTFVLLLGILLWFRGGHRRLSGVTTSGVWRKRSP